MQQGNRNPFEVTLLDASAPAEAEGEFEHIRSKHLGHETSIRSMALFYYFLSGLLGVWQLFFLIGLMAAVIRYRQFPNAIESFVALVIMGLAALLFAVAVGLRRLSRWSRVAGAILSFFGLLFFPIGTVANSYFLYLLLSRKGTVVFSPRYKEAIAATPGMKYQTSIAAWVALFVILLLLVATFVVLFVGVEI